MLVVCGCAADPVHPCEGAVPAIEACERGVAWADCGGDGAPRFACSGFDCLWFTGGCVAEGFVASPCPATDLCCQSTSSGSAAGPFSPVTGSERDFGVHAVTLGWGTEPWDAQREAHLSVSVAVLPTASRPSLACDAPGELLVDAPCDAGPTHTSAGTSMRGHVATAYVGWSAGTYAGHGLVIEVFDLDGSPRRARVCAVPFSDAATGGCATPAPRGCAVSGTVTLDHFPFDATAQMDVDATFADGSTAHVRI